MPFMSWLRRTCKVAGARVASRYVTLSTVQALGQNHDSLLGGVRYRLRGMRERNTVTLDAPIQGIATHAELHGDSCHVAVAILYDAQ